MILFIKDVIRAIVNHSRTLILWLLGFATILIILSGVFAFKATDSEFCDSCHYMTPYVKHWQASSHSDVDCVKCHDYGLGSLTVSSFKYFTGIYNSRPKANVPDENCMALDCHDSKLLDDKTEYQNNVIFNHTVHLEKPLRGEKLRCSSCHNRIVQSADNKPTTHMAINNMTCFVCHFKDAGIGEAITGCDACHGMPKTKVEHAGFTFSHDSYLELGVECKQCHTNIVKGDGSINENKCYSCHLDRDRNGQSREELHAIHVTEGGIDCFSCHSEIQHGNFEMVSALDIQCESCHLRQHNKQKQLYMGIGGKQTHDLPSQMFLAQVSCAGCHTDITPEGNISSGQSKKEPARATCVSCHGNGYDLMYDNWLSGSKKVMSEFSKYIKSVETASKSFSTNKKTRTRIKEAIHKAKSNLSFVTEGHIPHNIQYSLAMLNASADSIEAVFGLAKASSSLPKRGSSLNSENSCLLFCHQNHQPAETVDYDDSELPHILHFEDMEIACSSCHSLSEHGTTQVDQTICEECH